MKFKLTSLEKKWVLYDVGNSAFTMMVSTIFPIYFNYLAGNAGISDVDYLAYWGYATSVCTLLVAILGPTLGAIADTKNFKKTVFFVAMGVGVFGCILLGFLSSWIWFLGIFVLAKTGYSASLIFYDAMLTDVTDPERMDAVSSHGYAWGYIGSCIPFVACLGVVLGAKPLGIGMQTAMIIAFIITALWWLLSSVPLLRSYRQKYFAEVNGHVVKDSFKRLGKTFAELVKEKHIFVFLLAFFFYIDGVYTVIDMATAYGQALGLDSTGLLLALLVTQIVAFPSVLIFGRIVKKVSPEKIITVCIMAYFGIAVYAYWLDTQFDFWMLAVLVGMFQGTIQALSRSYFAKIIPAEKSGEYFGIYDICGKGASVIGTALVSFISQMTGSINIAVSALSVMFLVGLVLFRYSAKLITLDNEEASVEVVDNIPFTKESTTRNDNDFTTQSMDYKDVGVKLKITPRISDDGSLRLEVEQEVSRVTQGLITLTNGDQLVAPTTRKRLVKTTILLQDSQTAVIGGLLDDQKTYNQSEVPGLGSIPVLGWLFKSRNKKSTQTNLFIFITPKVIRNAADSADLTREKQLVLHETSVGHDGLGLPIMSKPKLLKPVFVN